jgi:DNA mismatch repair protein MutS2
MEFDANTLQPLYNIRIGLPGASNALAISRRLGLKESILDEALGNLSAGAQAFEHIVRSAEESRILAEETLKETNRLKAEWQEKLRVLEDEQAKLKKEKERLSVSAKAEARRIIHDKTADAEAILEELETLFAKESLTEGDLIQARTLKNKLGDQAYFTDEDESQIIYQTIADKDLQVGKTVFVKSMGAEGEIQSVRFPKKEAEVLCGNLRVRSKFGDLAVVVRPQIAQPKKKKENKQKDNVQVKKSLVPKPAPTLEINVIGKTVLDALPDVEAFLDSAVISGLEEVRIVHGVGTGKLRAGIQEYLRKNPHVAEFRYGKYGEGETGVTIVKIK